MKSNPKGISWFQCHSVGTPTIVPAAPSPVKREGDFVELQSRARRRPAQSGPCAVAVYRELLCAALNFQAYVETTDGSTTGCDGLSYDDDVCTQFL